MVIIIAGSLATYALPRFFNQDSFENRGFYTEVLNAVRYAQQLAVAINCNTQVTLTSNTYTVNMDSDSAMCNGMAFGTPAPDPVTGQAGFSGTSPDAGLTADSIQFNALGQANKTVTISYGGYSFQVIQETGYIEEL